MTFLNVCSLLWIWAYRRGRWLLFPTLLPLLFFFSLTTVACVRVFIVLLLLAAWCQPFFFFFFFFSQHLQAAGFAAFWTKPDLFFPFSHPNRTGASRLITGCPQGTFMHISSLGNALKLLLIIRVIFNYTGIWLTFGHSRSWHTFPKMQRFTTGCCRVSSGSRIRVT